MRFLYIKNEQVCNYCGAALASGEEAIVIRIRLHTGWIKPCFFHTDTCFQNWNNEVFVNRLLQWRQSATPRPKQRGRIKIGRPTKYSNSTLARRLKALLWYHRRLGHLDKVTELEVRRKALEILG